MSAQIRSRRVHGSGAGVIIIQRPYADCGALESVFWEGLTLVQKSFVPFGEEKDAALCLKGMNQKTL